LTSLAAEHPRAPVIAVALSKTLAATGRFDEAIAAAKDACDIAPGDPGGWEQLASIFADIGDADRLEPVVAVLERIAPMRATTKYYGAAAQFTRGRYPTALALADEAVARDPRYAAAHNLRGAIHA